MDFGQGQVMEFAKKMTKVSSDLISFLTKLPSKGQEIHVTNYRKQIPVLIFLYLLCYVIALLILHLCKCSYLLKLELFQRGDSMFTRNFAR